MTEYLDILDRARRRTGRLRGRDDLFREDEYYLVVSIWVRDSAGNLLLTKRHPEKRNHPNYWEVTGGFVLAGEESLAAARRELLEEVGLAPPEREFYFMGSSRFVQFADERDKFCDFYLVTLDRERPPLKLQGSEVADFRWVPLQEYPGFAVSHPMEPFTPAGYALFESQIKESVEQEPSN